LATVAATKASTAQLGKVATQASTSDTRVLALGSLPKASAPPSTLLHYIETYFSIEHENKRVKPLPMIDSERCR
jgi:hypothetical protein